VRFPVYLSSPSPSLVVLEGPKVSTAWSGLPLSELLIQPKRNLASTGTGQDVWSPALGWRTGTCRNEMRCPHYLLCQAACPSQQCQLTQPSTTWDRDGSKSRRDFPPEWRSHNTVFPTFPSRKQRDWGEKGTKLLQIWKPSARSKSPHLPLRIPPSCWTALPPARLTPTTKPLKLFDQQSCFF